ncbi:uncharacterized protein LOC110097044 isoform X3 [Dendrobium catenatum]|uniref:uncharacterized protein LOC110097044 isoform X3 n=1 Tax=Dendrobium catenatum TaxID=906689 RepID=UPI0009F6F7F3|nr:uncharacterized protein LOC110097044 isoform X3 [Dendrobium catenatum]
MNCSQEENQLSKQSLIYSAPYFRHAQREEERIHLIQISLVLGENREKETRVEAQVKTRAQNLQPPITPRRILIAKRIRRMIQPTQMLQPEEIGGKVRFTTEAISSVCITGSYVTAANKITSPH